MSKARILIIAHGHPEISKGGGEIAAYNLFTGLKACEEVEKVVFIARADRNEHESTPFGVWKEDELLFHSNMSDFFLLAQENKAFIWKEFRSFLESFKPTIVHFHHYMHLGLEMLREVKNYNPKVKLFLTLHEYHGICFNLGQMVKTNSKKLCYKSSPRECHLCFPEISAGDFLLREKYIKSFFEKVDYFISPSDFLINRYVKWGLEEKKITMIENGHPSPIRIPQERKNQEKVVFGFFGQINPFKGVDVLLEALTLLPKSILRKIQLHINGANLEHQAPDFKSKVQAKVEELKSVVLFQGSYEPKDQFDLMQMVDWVVIPSIWWENAPMVIQEAFNAGKPIICSNIGGMAEKVENGKDGLHFMVGKPADLAKRIMEVVEDRNIQKRLMENVQPAQSIEKCTKEHLAIYSKMYH